MYKLAKEFTVRRQEWLRGIGPDSTLLRGDGMKCCVGFFAQACGISDHFLTYNDTLHEALNELDGDDEIDIELDIFNSALENSLKIYAANDDEGISDEARETMLIELFAQYGITIRFED